MQKHWFLLLSLFADTELHKMAIHKSEDLQISSEFGPLGVDQATVHCNVNTHSTSAYRCFFSISTEYCFLAEVLWHRHCFWQGCTGLSWEGLWQECMLLFASGFLVNCNAGRRARSCCSHFQVCLYRRYVGQFHLAARPQLRTTERS